KNSDELNLDDLVAARAAGCVDLDGVADFLADQRACYRRGDGDAARLHVRFLVADDLVRLLLFRILVDDGHGGAELDLVAAELGNIDDLGPRDEILKFADAAFVEALLLLGGVIFGIFGKVAVRARLGDRLDDARPLLLLAPAQFFLQRFEPFACHRDLVHGLPSCRPPFPGWGRRTKRKRPVGSNQRNRLTSDSNQYSYVCTLFTPKKPPSQK